MIEEKRNASTYVFGLDIGTRSIVGTVGYRNQNRFIVVAAGEGARYPCYAGRTDT